MELTKELREAFIASCETFLIEKRCLAIACVRCPAYRTYNNGVDCLVTRGSRSSTADEKSTQYFTAKLAELKKDTMEKDYDGSTPEGKRIAMMDGMECVFDENVIGYYDANDNEFGPFVYCADGCKSRLMSAWDYPCTFRKREPPKVKEYKSRNKVLGFLCNTPGIAARVKGSTCWEHPSKLSYSYPIKEYEWTTISLSGEYGEPMEFLK